MIPDGEVVREPQNGNARMIRRKDGLITFTCDNVHCPTEGGATFETIDLGVEPAWRDAHYAGWRRQRPGRTPNSDWVYLCARCGR
jgi:hypothetical protein